ncbi:hypothetical protein SAMN05421821_114134 [Mucilaginibacter lappiensis]|nr:hypothetical protein SAMN05421821_114134 [Mucilaginibacter lappiensis]
MCALIYFFRVFQSLNTISNNILIPAFIFAGRKIILMLYPLYFLFELFAFICCVYAYKKLDNNFKIFLPFLAFVVVYEFMNLFFIKLLLLHHSNAWCNNLEGIIELLVYGQFMASLDERKRHKKRVYMAVAIGLVISLIDIFFIHTFWTVATIAFSSQSIILATMAFVYLYNLFSHADEYPYLLRFPPFLAAIGLLLYSLASYFFFASFDNLLVKNNYHFYPIAYLIHEMGCLFIYVFLGLAFLCFTRFKKLY